MRIRPKILILTVVTMFLGLTLFSTTSFAAGGKEQIKKGVSQRVQSLENLYSEFSQKMATLTANVTSLKSSVDQQSSNISDLKQLIQDQSGEITTLTNQVSLLKGEIDQLKTQGSLPSNNTNPQFIAQGTVTDASGNPVSGALIRLYDSGGYYGSSTDQNGHYSINLHNAGPFSLIVSEKGYLVATQSNVMVSTQNPTATVNLILKEGGTISGQVTYGQGLTVSYSSIKLFDQNNNLVNELFVNADGSYQFNAIPGTYTLELDTYGGSNQTQKVTVNVIKDQTITKNFSVN